MLIQKDGSVHPALLGLIRVSGLEVMDESSQAINEMLQVQWKASEGVQRAQIQGRLPTDEEMEFLNPLGAEAIPIDFDIPYGGTILLGATLKAIARRLKFLHDQVELTRDRENLIKKGSIPQPVFFLGSRRPLDPKQEMPEHISAIAEAVGVRFGLQMFKDRDADDWPKHEIAMMNRVQRWFNFDVTTYYVLAPDGKKPDNTPRPANTAETVKAWLEVVKSRRSWLKDSNIDRYLIVSSQPFCDGQLMAVRRAIKEAGAEGYTFDVCGPAAPPLPLDRWKDNLAKQLWEEIRLLSK